MTDQTTPTQPVDLEVELVDAELTAAQFSLLDALRDVALDPEAPAAQYATEQIARLAGEAFGYPLPEPKVVRTGGFADMFLGRPVRVDELAAGGPIFAPPRRPEGRGATPLAVVVDELHQAEDDDAAERWPFKPGDAVLDSGEDADHAAWLEAAPDGAVVADHDGTHWRRSDEVEGWIAAHPTAADVLAGPLTSANLEQRYGPLRVVSVPEGA